MLSFSRLGRPELGRLGNQLFQVSFITNFAHKFNIDYKIPYWRYAEYIDHKFNFSLGLSKLNYDLVIEEPSLGYHEDFFLNHLPEIRDKRVNIATGYFQSYRYFTKQHVLKVFRFNDKFKSIKIDPSKSVAISVRRGDFVLHPHFNNIEAGAFKAVLKNFKKHKVFVFTDDFNYCKNEFTGPQYEFMEGLNDIEQLITMSKFELFILSNSTFSYWGPMLNPDTKKVWYPYYMFPDLNRCKLYNEIYWPQESDIYVPYMNLINKML
jgi:hypothetical protein